MQIKRLNNRGWGLNTLLILGACLLVFLLIAAYYIYSLYSVLGIDRKSVYHDLENKLVQAAQNYNVNKDYISYETLKKNNYIDGLYDNNGNECNGYVVYKNYEYKAYIDCEYYTSNGYDINKLLKNQ